MVCCNRLNCISISSNPRHEAVLRGCGSEGSKRHDELFSAKPGKTAARDVGVLPAESYVYHIPTLGLVSANSTLPVHFTAIALNGGTISFQLMSYALSRLGPLAARGWTQHFTAIFRQSGTNGSILVNVEATNSPDGVVVDTLLHGYNPPQLTSSSSGRRPHIPNSHNDAGGKQDLSERVDHMSYLSELESGLGT